MLSVNRSMFIGQELYLICQTRQPLSIRLWEVDDIENVCTSKEHRVRLRGVKSWREIQEQESWGEVQISLKSLRRQGPSAPFGDFRRQKDLSKRTFMAFALTLPILEMMGLEETSDSDYQVNHKSNTLGGEGGIF